MEQELCFEMSPPNHDVGFSASDVDFVAATPTVADDWGALITKIQLYLSSLSAEVQSHDRLPWSYVCETAIRVLQKYSTGVTYEVLTSEIQAQWKNHGVYYLSRVPKHAEYLRCRPLPIDLLSSGRKFPPGVVLQGEISETFWDSIRQSYIIQMTGTKSDIPVMMLLHSRFSHLFHQEHSFVTKGASIRLRDCVQHKQYILPQENVIFIPREEDISIILQSFHDDIRIIKDRPTVNFDELRMLVRIEQIGESFSCEDEAFLIKQHIILVDAVEPSRYRVDLILFDHQVESFAGFLAEGDLIAIERPFAVFAPGMLAVSHILYGSATVVYLVDEQYLDKASSSQILGTASGDASTIPSIVKHSKGTIDCTSKVERTYIKDIRKEMINFSLLGRIQDMNRGFREGEESLSGNLMDTSGEICFECKGPVCRIFTNVCDGQVVFLQGLFTSKSDGHGKSQIRLVEGITSLLGVSTLRGLLASPSLFQTSLLCKRHEAQNFFAKVDLVEIEDYPTDSSADFQETRAVSSSKAKKAAQPLCRKCTVVDGHERLDVDILGHLLSKQIHLPTCAIVAISCITPTHLRVDSILLNATHS